MKSRIHLGAVHMATIAALMVATGAGTRGEETAGKASQPKVQVPSRVVRPAIRLQLAPRSAAPRPNAEQPVAAALTREQAERETPTHRQTGLLKIDGGDLSKTKINCFATTSEGYVLAGCGTNKQNGEVRVFDAEGNYVETWSSPVMVEAIGVRKTDGAVFLAGNGQLVKLDATGNLVANEQSPHATVSKEQAEKIREDVINRNKQMITTYKRQIEVYQTQIERTEEQIKSLKAQLDQLAADDDQRDQVEAKLKTAEQRTKQFANAREAWVQRVETLEKSEPSDEQIQAQIDAQIARKLAVASISAVDDKVYVACSATVGYGYSVWRIDEDLKGGEEIVSDLRGCCGQMDVQACDEGIFVAENARHRVVCFDPAGKESASWGSSGEGADGFSSCCNPMNVAFGTNGTVYTAESTSGRIKRYGTDGKLQQVIGTVDLVPGCKKVSIGVGISEDRVYMLDITRNHVIVMERIPAEERKAMIEKAMGAEAADDESTQASTTSAARLQAATARPGLRAVPALRLQVVPSAADEKGEN